ncbi:MAG: glycosyltransferase family 4 protein [Candidatus Marinimicrobia bacterium]|nr:glycosyltransferase family 4 protein [Candidatus Neomarinimicrobiota bacterium]
MVPKIRGKVLLIASVYTHLAAFHKPFIQLLKNKGYEIHTAASSSEGRINEIESLGVKCWDIPFARSPYSLKNYMAYCKLRQLLICNYFSLIHVHTPMAAFSGRYLAKATHQGPVLYTAHGFHFFKGASKRNWLLYYNAERLASKWTDGLIVMNEEDFEAGKRLGFLPGKDLFFVHGVGVDLNKYGEIRSSLTLKKSLGISSRDLVISCVAEFIPNKNHVFLLKAWSYLAQKYNNIHLVLVGDGKLRHMINKVIDRERLQRVFLLGFRNDVPEILAESDIVTLVSKREGLPRCIMEAMASKKPVVATDVRGSRDLVKHGKTGFLVPLDDVSALVKAFETLINNTDLRNKMGQAGREVIQDYSIDRVIAEMEEIYDMFLQK